MSDWTTPNLPSVRFSQAAFKASHNSYVRDERPVTTQFDWSEARPQQAACRGIELDIQQSRDFHGLWSVNHGGGYKGELDRQFSRYLELLDRESTARPAHDVITVTVDLKSVRSPARSFGADLDAYIAEHLAAEKLFTPAALEDQFASDRSARKPEGWPTLAKLKGRLVFCLSGKREWKRQYRRHGGSLCFTDQKANHPDDVDTSAKSPVFYNLNWDIWTEGIRHRQARVRKKWLKALEQLASHERAACRAYGLNNDETWKEARLAGMNLLSTDKVRNHEWAKVGAKPFAKATFRL